jgi:putative transposase
MRIVGLPKSFYYVSRHGPIELSYKAHDRLSKLKIWKRLREEGYSSQQAAELVDVPRANLYRWQKRMEEGGLRGLEDRSHRPKNCRRPMWSPKLSEAVIELREQYGWGKEKLTPLLLKEGWQTSESTVGRILKRLKARGVLREAPRNGLRTRKRSKPRPYAVRKPRGYAVKRPGDLVQLDTLDVRPLSTEIFKHFTARDMVSRWDVVGAYRRATAKNAATFLDTLIERMPFPVRAIQVDGGGEFMAQFEQACSERSIRLFVLPPRSPKLNGHVERAQRTHTEEFYDRYLGELDLESLNKGLREWERIYNTVRPHHSLDLMTPEEYLYEHHSGLAPPNKLSHMY